MADKFKNVKVYRSFEEMYAHLRNKVETVEPKEYEEPKAEPKKRTRKKKTEE